MDELLIALGEFIEAVRAGGTAVESGMASANLTEPFARLTERYEAATASKTDEPAPAGDGPTYTYN